PPGAGHPPPMRRERPTARGRRTPASSSRRPAPPLRPGPGRRTARPPRPAASPHAPPCRASASRPPGPSGTNHPDQPESLRALESRTDFPRDREGPMKPYDAASIRNVLLLGHGGAGKTTLMEAMLFAAGAITRMGKVEDGNTVSDHDPEEVRKGISVSLSMAPLEVGEVKLNLLDAPGYADFVGDVYSAIRAVDAVLLVVSAVEGVEVQTEIGWELAAEAGLPRAILINKMDRERASFERTLDGLVKAFGTQVAPLQFPLGEEHLFEGVADLLSR